MKVKATIELSARETEFVRGLSDGLRPTVAAVAAGYSQGHTRALLAKPQIAAALLALHQNTGVILAVIDPPDVPEGAPA